MDHKAQTSRVETLEDIVSVRVTLPVHHSLEELLKLSSSMHKHLCPRQVLGVRMGLLAGNRLSVEVPQVDKRLFTVAETDGCAVDGISVGTNCWVGHRTLRIEDYGKVAATFVDTKTERAVRIAPRPGIRERARQYAPAECSRWESQLLGYQRMPDDELFHVVEVELVVPIEKIISHRRRKAVCEECGEEIKNEREVSKGNMVLCRGCSGESYYRAKAINPPEVRSGEGV